MIVDRYYPVSVRLLVPDKIPPDMFIEFLYDNESTDPKGYIDILPNITFRAETGGDQTRVIIVHSRHYGHLVVTARSPQVNISSAYDFLLIDIARSNTLNVFVQLFGWIYFFAWSISFYPQIILNFRRRSVVGLNFDFLALNLLGHSCYMVFNIGLYASEDIQQEYHTKYPHSVLPVLLNDVLFSIHAVLACIVTVTQCAFFDRGNQRISYVAFLFGGLLVAVLLVSTILAFFNHLSILQLVYFYSYVKIAITLIKYVPQAWMNYRKKSTEGWSIGNILLDLTGGILSISQMFFLAINYNDWISIFGSPTKFALGLFSVLFDAVFILQHYLLYATSRRNRRQSDLPNNASDERSRLLTYQS